MTYIFQNSRIFKTGAFSKQAHLRRARIVEMSAGATIVRESRHANGSSSINRAQFPRLRAFAQFSAMLTMAAPGLLPGAGLRAFLERWPGPLNTLYGTLFISVLNTFAHRCTGGLITALKSRMEIASQIGAMPVPLAALARSPGARWTTCIRAVFGRFPRRPLR